MAAVPLSLSGMRIRSEEEPLPREDGVSMPIKTGTLAGYPSDTETPSFI